MSATICVCPERDIECGGNRATWCAACPKRAQLAEQAMPPPGYRLQPESEFDAYSNVLEQLAASEARVSELRAERMKDAKALSDATQGLAQAVQRIAAYEARERGLVKRAWLIFGEALIVYGTALEGEDTGRVIATFSHHAEAQALADFFAAIAKAEGA